MLGWISARALSRPQAPRLCEQAAGVLRTGRTCDRLVNSGAGQMNRVVRDTPPCPAAGALAILGQRASTENTQYSRWLSQSLRGHSFFLDGCSQVVGTHRWQPSGAPEPLKANTSLGRCSANSLNVGPMTSLLPQLPLSRMKSSPHSGDQSPWGPALNTLDWLSFQTSQMETVLRCFTCSPDSTWQVLRILFTVKI